MDELREKVWIVTGASGGLGLAIVKSTVESAGGSVTAASTPGLGTEFVLRLPPFSG